jgi:hypothetical protein
MIRAETRNRTLREQVETFGIRHESVRSVLRSHAPVSGDWSDAGRSLNWQNAETPELGMLEENRQRSP